MHGPARGLAAALLAATFAASPAAAQGLVFKDADLKVTIDSRGAPGAGGARSGLVVRAEAAPGAMGFRSIRTRMDVDCARRRLYLKESTGFDRPALAGAAHPVLTSPQWVRPVAGAYLDAVLQAVCGRERGAQLAALDPPAAQKPPAPAAPIPALPALEPLRPAPPARGARAPAAAPAAAGRFAIQILSSPDKAEAEAALARLAKARPEAAAGLTLRVVAAQVDGRPYNRAQASGFATAQAARQFCAEVAAQGFACFVRAAGG